MEPTISPIAPPVLAVPTYPATPAPQAPATPAPPPTPATPAPQAPAIPTMPVQSTPAIPATGVPAAALPRENGVHGILAHIALGALAGAAEGIAKKAGGAVEEIGGALERGVSNLAESSPIYQNKVNDNLARQSVQQKMQQSEIAAQDAHTLNKVRVNSISMDNLAKQSSYDHLTKTYPMLEQQARNTLAEQNLKLQASDRDLMSNLSEMGIDIDTEHGGGYDNLTQGHARDVAQGKSMMISNGKSGADAGFGFISNDQLANTVLDKDIQIAFNWKINPKTGDLTPVYRTLKSGQNTALDALILKNAGDKKFLETQQQYAAYLADRQKQSEVIRNEATAAKSNRTDQPKAPKSPNRIQAINAQIRIAQGQLKQAQSSFDTNATAAAQQKLNSLYQQLGQLSATVPNSGTAPAVAASTAVPKKFVTPASAKFATGPDGHRIYTIPGSSQWLDASTGRPISQGKN